MAEKRISDLFFLAHKKISYVIDHFRSYLEETDYNKGFLNPIQKIRNSKLKKTYLFFTCGGALWDKKIRIPFMGCNTIFLLAFHYGVLEGDMAIFITSLQRQQLANSLQC